LAGTGQDGDGDGVVAVELYEGVAEAVGGGGVDGVADGRTVDRDDANGAAVVDANGVAVGIVLLAAELAEMLAISHSSILARRVRKAGDPPRPDGRILTEPVDN
jgi:hypothetical protein